MSVHISEWGTLGIQGFVFQSHKRCPDLQTIRNAWVRDLPRVKKEEVGTPNPWETACGDHEWRHLQIVRSCWAKGLQHGWSLCDPHGAEQVWIRVSGPLEGGTDTQGLQGWTASAIPNKLGKIKTCKDLRERFHKGIDLGKDSQLKPQWAYRLSLINPIYKWSSASALGRESSLHHLSLE